MANLLYNLAQPFSNTKQYTQGAIVIYNDRMYEMTADEYTPGPFDPEKFTERFLSEMISGKLNSNLNNINESMSFGTSGTTHTSEIGKYYIAFRIANTTVDSQRKITFEGVEFAKELLGVTSTSVGCVYAIYLIKASDTTVTSSLTCLLMQISK